MENVINSSYKIDVEIIPIGLFLMKLLIKAECIIYFYSIKVIMMWNKLVFIGHYVPDSHCLNYFNIAGRWGEYPKTEWKKC